MTTAAKLQAPDQKPPAIPVKPPTDRTLADALFVTKKQRADATAPPSGIGKLVAPLWRCGPGFR
ncbi:hypothetical protein EH165_11080 [Nakamurella antarctica]|uniref:Uncharacterized protein n=1 Tax=Nakamurella antarctica TaxID=1902245 RepID=A0A3G8ZVW0_9ACTN|nr:hypothetical protein [Nakamurella antarctica]AZI58594.1 hypothetical protein EH165_11080 [Nakamurella antarctica]